MVNKQQQGSALAVGLVLLAIMTVLGTAALNTTLLGEKMVANTQHNTLAFHTADSSVTKTSTLLRINESQANASRNAKENNQPAPELSYPELSGTKDSSNTTTLEFGDKTHTNGNKANDRNGVIGHRFIITSEAKITNTPTSSTIRQSVGKGPYVRDPVKEFTSPP